MGLQRTPPPGAQTAAPRPPPDVGPSTSEQANTSLEAFVPRHPRVMRSPQSGSTSSGSRQMAPPPPPAVVPVPELEMEMDEGEGAGDISTTPRTEPPEQAASAISQNAQPSTSTDMPPPPATRPAPDAFTTPLPKRRKSRNDPRPAVANAPPPPPPAQEPEDEEEEGELTQFERNAMYGKMYKGLMDTLDVAVSAASQRWTLQDFTKCFPMFAAENKESFEQVYESTRAALRSNLWAETSATIDANSFGPALKKIEEAIQEAQANQSEHGRPDAWRPELSAKTISAAANLPVLDETYTRLRTEYLELHSDCAKRYTSIASKQALLKELESTVGDGVVDLEKTIEAMQDFPTDDMRKWMEDVMPTLDGGRVA